MTAVLVAAGRRLVTIDDVRRMLAEPDNPSFHEAMPEVYRVPSHGLYLANVEYDDKGLHSSFCYL